MVLVGRNGICGAAVVASSTYMAAYAGLVSMFLKVPGDIGLAERRRPAYQGACTGSLPELALRTALSGLRATTLAGHGLKNTCADGETSTGTWRAGPRPVRALASPCRAYRT